MELYPYLDSLWFGEQCEYAGHVTPRTTYTTFHHVTQRYTTLHHVTPRYTPYTLHRTSRYTTYGCSLSCQLYSCSLSCQLYDCSLSCQLYGCSLSCQLCGCSLSCQTVRLQPQLPTDCRYAGYSPDEWLAEVSGVPFGLPGQILGTNRDQAQVSHTGAPCGVRGHVGGSE